MSEELDLKEINKKIQKKLDEYEKAFGKLTMEDMAESASRMYKMEFDQENPIKPKKTSINITGQDIKLSGFTQSKIDPTMESNMMIPPMVGVPFLAII